MIDEKKRAEPLKQAAASYGASYDTFFRASRSGRLRVIRIGARLYVPADELERISREGLVLREPVTARRGKVIATSE